MSEHRDRRSEADAVSTSTSQPNQPVTETAAVGGGDESPETSTPASDGMVAIEVGKPLIEGRTRWPSGVVYDYVGGFHTLRVFIERPTPREVSGLSAGSGPIHLGLVVLNETLLLGMQAPRARFDGDAPFSIHLVPVGSRVTPPVCQPGETRAFIQVILVDAATGIVRVLRTSTMSNAFTIALHDAIRKQEREPFTPQHHDENIRRLYASHPTVASVMQAAVVKTSLGD